MYASIDAVLEYLDESIRRRRAGARGITSAWSLRASIPNVRNGRGTRSGAAVPQRSVSPRYSKSSGKPRSTLASTGASPRIEYFYAEQNARIIANAERYYRAMIDYSASTWNLRDEHMADTLDRCSITSHGIAAPPKPSCGRITRMSARADATAMVRTGRLNIGALDPPAPRRRERFDRLFDLYRERDGGLRLARPRGTQARAAGATRQLRVSLPRTRRAALLDSAAPYRPHTRGPSGASPRTRDRRHLSVQIPSCKAIISARA